MQKYKGAVALGKDKCAQHIYTLDCNIFLTYKELVGIHRVLGALNNMQNGLENTKVASAGGRVGL